jgi:hypothetical protein
MNLVAGRLADLVEGNLAQGTALVCHLTTIEQQPDGAALLRTPDRRRSRVLGAQDACNHDNAAVSARNTRLTTREIQTRALFRPLTKGNM